ncbi:PadR-like family transcriptional regulator [Paenibacillus mucilaginosus 3016]|uniref:PadR-like family transcriptional regulator n=1 Tax=Paenibacillus mucilaginosus 3016 TaxID=1116391 RepID=H6NHE8_9BACL|nr:PadR-like family transcriptional regulator [Paenibacillus mucilaginosus 3016]
MSENKITSDLLRGHTDTMILRLLSEAYGYGYEIVKLIAERSGGAYEQKGAKMYSGFRRLEADGDIEWYWAMNHRGDVANILGLPKGARTYIHPQHKQLGVCQTRIRKFIIRRLK